MAKNLSRREFGVAAAAASLAQATAQTDPMEDPALDPVTWTRSRHASAPLKLTFQAGSKGDAQKWQKKLRGKLEELVGGFPDKPSPLNAQTIEKRDFPTFRREKVLFESRPGVKVAAYLLTPINKSGPFAPVISVPGHGRGADDLVGIDEKGADRATKVGYQYDYAIQLVEHGMAAIAIEPMGFGCRRDAITKRKGPGASACQPAAGAALLLGETMVGWRVYDVMRTADWIATRKELDIERLGCMGISGGGTVTVFSAALDTRIRAALVSGYLNTFRDSILSLSHCIDNYVPGILQWAEMYDVAGLIAPRPLFAESGTRDPIFPIEGSKASFAKVKHVYEVLGVPELAEHEVFDGVHVFHGIGGLKFLARHLKA